MYYQKQPRHARDAIPVDVRNVEGRLNRIVEYLFIVYWPSVCELGSWVRAFYYN